MDAGRMANAPNRLTARVEIPAACGGRKPNKVSGNFLTLIARWNGIAWTQEQSPPLNPGDQFLYAVTASPDGAAFATGTYPSGSGDQGLALAIRLGVRMR